MERKKLKLEDSNNVFDKYKNNVDSVSKKDSKADIKKIEEIAKIQGFTKREHDQKNKSNYTEQFNVKCKEGLGDLITDILYQQKDAKLKKQELLEESILAYLEKNNFKELVEKYKLLFS
jgi:hypothetical protein